MLKKLAAVFLSASLLIGLTPAAAMALADRVQGVVASLPLRESASGATWTTSDPMLPYPNPDPHRPLVPRATFRATVGARGVPVDL